MKDSRQNYRDEGYVRYWRQSANHSESPPENGTLLPDIATFKRYLDLLEPGPGKSLLEVGIGFGRLVPAHAEAGCRVYGIDISEAMIQEAQARYGNLAVELRQAQAEAIPYPNDFFDIVVCWAVFHALCQERALAEMARVLKIEGQLLVSGKNDDYYDDDRAAYEAELGARAKGNPGYFTNYTRLIERLAELGMQPTVMLFLERCGDTGQNRILVEPPQHFYEYIFMARKVRQSSLASIAPISSECSRTFGRLASAEGS